MNDLQIEAQLRNIRDHEDRIERAKSSGDVKLEKKWTRLHGVLVERLRDHCNLGDYFRELDRSLCMLM